ncbi:MULTISPECIES: ribokinase [Rossellomorea]|jgi:ribokinase|uniref:ribokinase n=1 Tax=Rossellomorea TaxID=2837508 RepID=UPI0028EEB203|nr:ribokinase [Rossellomorea sp. YC4-1]
MVKEVTRIAVIGSINIDYVVETDVLPIMGETVSGKNYFLSPGGKGANQAVAASRLGADVALYCSVGKDENGSILLRKMAKENINLTGVNHVEGVATGAAFIELCKGENRILIVPGANELTNSTYIRNVLTELIQYDVFLFQLETPIEMLEFLIPILHEKGKTIIVNPAPAYKLSKALVQKISYLIPNEHEYKTVLGTDLPYEEIIKNHPNKLIITRGKDGVTYFDGADPVHVQSLEVTPVDTTGAGDTFSGAFAVAISEGKNLVESIRYGNIAAGLSILKKGAQSGMPTKEEIEEFMNIGVSSHESQGLFKSN